MYWWGALYLLVPLAGVIGWSIYMIQRSKYRAQERNAELAGSSDLRDVVAQNSEVSRQLLAKLESMDQRLAAVEKTLNDIP
ncbi:hypothetical protein [Humibacter ginsenosidimutans]|uniref:Uncharacterized protein n=1 Tax=Humibacter ginsenosidimutans TaxID=2599293 RepID=A0A5B8M283_9MICO|nr:hypothetical protein [Humibacter ginsenosidimutans]QDZ14064.1 hypothetical protein FPZ11_04090 [Humibacter ginsenosidimutans]